MNKTLTMFGQTVERAGNDDRYEFTFGPLEVTVFRYADHYVWSTCGVFRADQGSIGKGLETAEGAARDAENALRSIHDALGAAVDCGTRPLEPDRKTRGRFLVSVCFDETGKFPDVSVTHQRPR